MRKVLLYWLFAIESCVMFSQNSTDCSNFQEIGYDCHINMCDPSDWYLVFSDEFNGALLDTTKWQLRPWGAGSFGNTQEYNKLSNAIINNGVLQIIAKRETIYDKAIPWLPDNEILPDGIQNLRYFTFSSSNIWTKEYYSYGKYEARIKIPKGKGFFPAFWLYSDNPWNEIDVFEFWNEKTLGIFDASKLSKVHHMTVHYDYDHDGQTNMCEDSYSGVDFSQDFHIYTVIWEKNKIQWYVDGSLVREYYSHYDFIVPDNSPQPVECDIYALYESLKFYKRRRVYPRKPMNIILNFAIQSNNDSPNNETILPAQLEVDWIRYYQKVASVDTIINNQSAMPLSDYFSNELTGNTIVFDGVYNVSIGENIELTALDSIVLKQGFHVHNGGYSKIKIVHEQ